MVKVPDAEHHSDSGWLRNVYVWTM
jgi:hypothetical protein